MADTVYLHLGTPKSGTTYIQAVLGANRERLQRKDRVLFPGRRWVEQVHAAKDVLHANPHDHKTPESVGAWQRLVDEMHAWDGNAVVSMEWLGSANVEQAARMVESLAPARVEVIITVRDLARTIPAAWQEFLQNWETWTWRRFLSDVSSEEPRSTPASRLFWTQQDLGRMLAIWTDVLDPEQIHVVTLPPSGAPAGELWSRFASVLGIDPHRYDAGGGSNESLGLESTELMRRINELSKQQGMTWPVYDARLKRGLAKRGLSRRKGLETAVTIPEEFHPWVMSRSAEQVAAIKSSGARVTGDLADLNPTLGPSGPQPEDLNPEAMLEAAVAGLVFATGDHAAEVARLRRRIEKLEGRGPKDLPGAPAPGGRVKRGLVDLSERHRAVMAARRAFTRARGTLRRGSR
jgi:hypothetical protein